jgi:hypothetical protein
MTALADSNCSQPTPSEYCNWPQQSAEPCLITNYHGSFGKPSLIITQVVLLQSSEQQTFRKARSGPDWYKNKQKMSSSLPVTSYY